MSKKRSTTKKTATKRAKPASKKAPAKKVGTMPKRAAAHVLSRTLGRRF